MLDTFWDRKVCWIVAERIKMGNLKQIVEEIDKKLKKKERVFVAIDGRCGSGKSTIAAELERYYNEKNKTAGTKSCLVLHMDDFFLRPEQRSPQRYATPGENVDHERFLEEVLEPASRGEDFLYAPFNCKLMQVGEGSMLSPCQLILVEGSYSGRTNFWEYFDLHIFVTVEKELQLERIEKRVGEERLKDFVDKWIPLEEAYFEAFELEKRCDIIVNNDKEFNLPFL